MSAEPQHSSQPSQPSQASGARRFLIRSLLTLAGIIGAILVFFVCQRMFAGYPQYHTGLLTFIGLILISLTGGVAWIIDERRINRDE